MLVWSLETTTIMDPAKYGISWIICFSLLFSSFTDGFPLGPYDDDLKIPKRCPDCKADIPGLRYRRAGEGGINVSEVLPYNFQCN